MACPSPRRPMRCARLGLLAVLPALPQRRRQLPARADAELAEHLTKVPFDRAGGEEQLGRDLRVGASVPGQPGNLLLLRGELAPGLDTALAHLLAGRDQLPAGG